MRFNQLVEFLPLQVRRLLAEFPVQAAAIDGVSIFEILIDGMSEEDGLVSNGFKGPHKLLVNGFSVHPEGRPGFWRNLRNSPASGS